MFDDLPKLFSSCKIKWFEVIHAYQSHGGICYWKNQRLQFSLRTWHFLLSTWIKGVACFGFYHTVKNFHIFICMFQDIRLFSFKSLVWKKKKTGGGFFMCSYSVLMRHFIFLKVILTRKHLIRIPFLFTFPLTLVVKLSGM